MAVTVVARVHGHGVCDRQPGHRPAAAAVRDTDPPVRRPHRRAGDRQPTTATANDRAGDRQRGLRARIVELEGKVETARRAGKRQAAPFSKGEPKADPKRAGRKAGQAYGTKAHRAAPDHVDEVVAVPAPDVCPGCGGAAAVEDTVCQWVEDIPPVVTCVTRYDLQVGRCAGCHRRVTGRHPSQVSDATGAAGSQIGPRAVSLAAVPRHELGVPHAKTAKVLAQVGGGVGHPGRDRAGVGPRRPQMRRHRRRARGRDPSQSGGSG
ncbi:MAG: hypothetical protein ACRDYX_00600 [Egibacteraceae bacterium]